MNETENILYEMTAGNSMVTKKAKRPEKVTRKQKKAAEKKAPKKEPKPKAVRPKKEKIKQKKVKKNKDSKSLFKVSREKGDTKRGRPFGPREGSVLNTDKPKSGDKKENLVYKDDLIKLAENIRKMAGADNIQIAHKNALGAISRNVKNIANFYEKRK